LRIGYSELSFRLGDDGPRGCAVADVLCGTAGDDGLIAGARLLSKLSGLVSTPT